MSSLSAARFHTNSKLNSNRSHLLLFLHRRRRRSFSRFYSRRSRLSLNSVQFVLDTFFYTFLHCEWLTYTVAITVSVDCSWWSWASSIQLIVQNVCFYIVQVTCCVKDLFLHALTFCISRIKLINKSFSLSFLCSCQIICSRLAWPAYHVCLTKTHSPQTVWFRRWAAKTYRPNTYAIENRTESRRRMRSTWCEYVSVCAHSCVCLLWIFFADIVVCLVVQK